MKLKTSLRPVFFGTALAGLAGSALAFQLPVANELNAQAYGDFNVYSIPVLEQCKSVDPRCQPSGPFPVSSNANWSKDQLLIMTASSGADQRSNNPHPIRYDTTVAGRTTTHTFYADDAFQSPSGTQGNFIMGTGVATEPAPTNGSFVTKSGTIVSQFAGDWANAWDIQIGALRSYLAGNDLVFFIDNSQNTNGPFNWLRVWGQVTVYDTDGAAKGCFQLKGDGVANGCTDRAEPEHPFNPYAPGSYVTAYTKYCIDKTTGEAFNVGGGTAMSCPLLNGYYISGNTGSQAAEYAAFSQTLHDFVATADPQWTLSVQLRTSNNSGAGESFWICSDCKVSRPTATP